MKNIIQISISTIMIICFWSCKNEPKATIPQTSEPQETWKTMILQTGSLNSSAQLSGILQPFQFVQIYSRVAGYVKSVKVDRGSRVQEGQVLITLEAPEIEQQAANAQLKFTQANAIYHLSKEKYFRMMETSHTPGTISDYDLSSAHEKMAGDSAVAQGEFANYKAMETMKNYLVIKAPFDGVITERNVHPGALVGTSAAMGKDLVTIQQISKLRLVAEVPDQYVSAVQVGYPVKYKFSSILGQEFTGSVSRTSGSLGTTYRTETIEIDVDNTKNQFKPGMYAEISLQIKGNNNVFVIPKSAILTTTEKKYVIELTGNKTKFIDIKEGNSTKDSIEVFGNLDHGAIIIVNGNAGLKEDVVLQSSALGN